MKIRCNDQLQHSIICLPLAIELTFPNMTISSYHRKSNPEVKNCPLWFSSTHSCPLSYCLIVRHFYHPPYTHSFPINCIPKNTKSPTLSFHWPNLSLPLVWLFATFQYTYLHGPQWTKHSQHFPKSSQHLIIFWQMTVFFPFLLFSKFLN